MRMDAMTGHAEVLPAYRQLRQVGIQLNHKLVKTLSTETLKAGGRMLGFLRNETFVFDSEDETSVLMDFCIHNLRVDGLNAVQRYLKNSPPPAGSDEHLLLPAMLRGYYSLFQVVETERGVGATVFDALRGGTHFLADIGFGATARPGDILATRVFPFEELGFLVSGGAALPVTPPTLARIRQELSRLFPPGTDFARLTPERESELAAMAIRVCLAAGMSERIAYGPQAETSSRKQKPVDPREVRAPNRNDPCPCGSGRKFKTCCGRRPSL